MKCKNDLRIFYKQKRLALKKAGIIDEISKLICDKIYSFDEIINAKNIMTFYPLGSELNTLSLLDNFKDKNFYLPLCKGEEIVVCPYKKGDKLSLNKYKIYEPVSKEIGDLSILDIVITPALCADKSFHRLGYGGGYYDRFFSNKNLFAKKIVIIPDEMLLDKLPLDDFDKKCDIIVTEKRILRRALG